MKRYIKKIMRVINFIKNEGKFDYEIWYVFIMF